MAAFMFFSPSGHKGYVKLAKLKQLFAGEKNMSIIMNIHVKLYLDN